MTQGQDADEPVQTTVPGASAPCGGETQVQSDSTPVAAPEPSSFQEESSEEKEGGHATISPPFHPSHARSVSGHEHSSVEVAHFSCPHPCLLSLLSYVGGAKLCRAKEAVFQDNRTPTLIAQQSLPVKPQRQLAEMFRVPLFFLVLSVGLMSVGGIASPFGYISSGFRSLAEYKLATTARLASFLVGDRAVKATIDLKVAGDPEETTEQAVIEEPAIAGPTEVVHHDEESPAKPQLIITTASDEEVNNFKKQFSAGYTVLDYANQLEKRRLAGAASTKPHYFDAPVLTLPLEHYKDFVTGGETGGSLMRVAIVPQDIPKPLFASPGLSGEQQEQLQPTEDNKTGAAPTLPEDQQQDHIFPYSGWQAVPPSGYSTYPQSSYQLPAAASEADAQTLDSHDDDDYTVEVNSTAPIEQGDVVIPGSQFPEPSSEGTPDAATPLPETGVPDQQPRKRRDVADAVEEEDDDPTSFPVPGTNLTIRGADVETYFRYLKKHDVSECLAKIFCLMAARPAAFGTNGTMMTEFFSSYRPMPGHVSIAFYKEASAAGSQGGDCHELFDKCTMSVEEMKAAFNHDVAL
ncbi:hypothetical protein MTO96_028544 [Rhipicephalus appendiculatus]